MENADVDWNVIQTVHKHVHRCLSVLYKVAQGSHEF